MLAGTNFLPARAAEPVGDLAFRRAIGVLSNPENRAMDPVLGLRAEDWAGRGLDEGVIDADAAIAALGRSGNDPQRWDSALAAMGPSAGTGERQRPAAGRMIKAALTTAIAREAAILRCLGPGSQDIPLPPILGVGQRPTLSPTAPLLASAIAAHGGMARWSALRGFTTHMSIGGALFARKKMPGKLTDIVVDGATGSAFSRLTGVGAPNRRILFTPDRIAVERAGGTTLARYADPVAAFKGHVDETPWEEVHLAYFCGYANWNYMVVPFAFAGEGFETEELTSVTSGGEIWRRLRVRFPASFPTHGTEQIYYFDDRYMLRRLDYYAPLAGSGHVAHFCDDHRVFDGIVVPTTRRAFRMDRDGNVLPKPLAIDIRISQTSFF